MTQSARASRQRWRGRGYPLVAAALLLVGCAQVAPDRRAQADDLTNHIRSMPGVLSATSDLTDSIPEGNVHFWLSVDVAEDVTAEQVAAVTTRYFDALRSVDYSDYDTELNVHRGDDLFAVDSGLHPVVNVDQVVGEARDWVALRREFPSATVNLRAAVIHSADATLPDPQKGHPTFGAIEFPDPADYTAVTAAATTLGARFPQLAGGIWTIDASKAHPATVTSSKRLPTPAELDVWSKLNADQAIPHVDALTINAPQTPPVWISEQTLTHDPAVALQLATDHLPIVATLPRPVLYTATDQLQGRRDFNVRTTGPVAVTIGGCTVRTYRPAPNEQRFIDAYENCRR
jgi:hypothetical protein